MLDPVIRPSLPTTTVPRLQYSANAAVYRTMISGVSVDPTIPRMPEMLTINDIPINSWLWKNVRNEGPIIKDAFNRSIGDSCS
jgi:hypothetical protein